MSELPDDATEDETDHEDELVEDNQVDNDSPQVCAACGANEGENHKRAPCHGGKFVVHR